VGEQERFVGYLAVVVWGLGVVGGGLSTASSGRPARETALSGVRLREGRGSWAWEVPGGEGKPMDRSNWTEMGWRECSACGR